MWLARFKSQAQGLARPEQMLLANHIIRRLRPKLLGQRRPDLRPGLGKQITQGNNPSGRPAI